MKTKKLLRSSFSNEKNIFDFVIAAAYTDHKQHYQMTKAI
jgi:hypothetical protein